MQKYVIMKMRQARIYYDNINFISKSFHFSLTMNRLPNRNCTYKATLVVVPFLLLRLNLLGLVIERALYQKVRKLPRPHEVALYSHEKDRKKTVTPKYNSIKTYETNNDESVSMK